VIGNLDPDVERVGLWLASEGSSIAALTLSSDTSGATLISFVTPIAGLRLYCAVSGVWPRS